MKLRTAILAAVVGLVLLIVAATVAAVAVIVNKAERRELDQNLARSRQLFDDLLGYRQSRYRSDCRVVANEPRLRAVVATQDISRDTIVGVVSELRTSLGSDLFLLTDARGTLMADALDPEAEGFDMSGMQVIASALESGEGAGVWITEDRPHQVQACRMDFGAQTVGVVLIGNRIGDEFAAAVHRQSGSSAVVTLDGVAVASSPLADGEAAPEGSLDGVTAGPGGQPVERAVAGSHYLALGGPFPGYEGKRQLSYAVLRSLDQALAPGRRLTQGVLLIAGIALLAALLLAVVLSRRLSRPVDALVQFTGRVGKGELDVRAPETGAAEVKTLAVAMNKMVTELDESRRELARKERLEKEMEIAMRIQTSILPRRFDVHGLEIAARMLPATEVGGDYYDILPVEGGCWIGVGDVAGHGLTAGLEMLMIQSVVSALVRENPTATPKNHLSVLNQVIYENIRNRLDQDEHVTLTLLRYQAGGLVTFAGAHEEILVCRAAGGPTERIDTPGTWLGAVRDIDRVTRDTTLELAPGDLMVLYSDGLTEARNASGVQFGIDRVCEAIEAARAESVETIRDRLITTAQAWEAEQEDDLSVVVVRRSPAGS